MYAIPIIALLVTIIIAFKLPIHKPKEVPIARLESDHDHDFGDVVKHAITPKPSMEVHTMFNVSEDSEKSYPLYGDTKGLTYDYWGA